MARPLKASKLPKPVDIPIVYKEVKKVKQQLSVYDKLKQFFNQFNLF